MVVPKRLIFPPTCAPFSKLPPNISTMSFPRVPIKEKRIYGG